LAVAEPGTRGPKTRQHGDVYALSSKFDHSSLGEKDRSLVRATLNNSNDGRALKVSMNMKEQVNNSQFVY
jgi:hypothetical protein